MNFSNTKLSFSRHFTSYAKVQVMIASVIRGRSFHINRKVVGRKEYLDLGCGPNTHEEFINLDYGWRPGIDICWNLQKGVPLADQSVKGVFTEHCLEHLTLEVADYVLSECRRVLRPSGMVRIAVPDGQLYLEGYTRIVGGLSDEKLPYAENLRYAGIYSPIMSVNEIFRDHGHLFIYDFDMLRQILEKNGFVDVKKESFQTGRDPKLLRDSAHREIESLYVEAVVPS